MVPFAGFDVIGLIHSATRQDLIRMTIKILEENMTLAAKSGENQVVVIFDMEAFNLRQYAWRPGRNSKNISVNIKKVRHIFFQLLNL